MSSIEELTALQNSVNSARDARLKWFAENPGVPVRMSRRRMFAINARYAVDRMRHRVARFIDPYDGYC